MGSKERHFAYITALHPEVTGSALPVSVTTSSVRKCNFLVDCGLFQEREYNYLNQNGFPFSCEKIEFVLITLTMLANYLCFVKMAFMARYLQPRQQLSS